MSGTIEIETAFPLVKPNVVPTLPTAPYYTGMVPVKKAKLDDVKLVMKYLSQPMTMMGMMISDVHYARITCDWLISYVLVLCSLSRCFWLSVSSYIIYIFFNTT